MTKMEQYRDDFFSGHKDSLQKNHVCRNHINKFIDYLSLPEVELSDVPARINISVVEGCIKYYHDKKELNSRSTMESHLESLKKFYDYLSESGKALDIFSSCNYSKFKKDIVEKYSLLEPVERGSYDCDDIKTILVKLDKAIDEFEEEYAGIREVERHLQRIIMRLFIKITLIAPTKKNIIAEIRKTDIKEEYKILTINGVDVNIPCGLSRDLCAALRYAEFRNKEPIKEDDCIFEYIYKHRGKFTVSSLNAWFYNIVRDCGIMKDMWKGRKTLSVEPIRNMVIQMMVNNKVNLVFISKISGLTFSAIESTYFPKDWSDKYKEEVSECINKGIIQNDYYPYI